jgi:isocitrate lyase
MFTARGQPQPAALILFLNSLSLLSLCFNSPITCSSTILPAMFRSIRRLPRRVPVVSTVSSRSLRPFTSGYTRMTPVQPPISTTLPSDAYQLLSTQEKAGAAEDALYDQQVRDVESWWKSPRYEGIKRPYTAADVVSKRGSLQQTYPSSLMARKLFNLLNERAAAGQPVHTSEFWPAELQL